MKTNYTAVGLFVIVLGFGTLFVGFWFSGMSQYKTYNNYYVYLDETVTGLTEKSNVKYNGVDVGYIESIRLNKTNLKQVKILLRIESDIPITVDTVATIATWGITGVTYISLTATSSVTELLKPKEGEIFAVIPNKASVLVQLDQMVTDVSSHIGSVSESIEQLLDEDGRLAFHEMLHNIRDSFEVVLDNRENINSSLHSMAIVLENTALSSSKFPDVTKQMSRSLASIENTAETMQQTVDKLGSSLEKTEKVLEQVASQLLPTTIEAMNNMRVATSNLIQVTELAANNPSAFVRGKSSRALGPGE